MASAEVLPVGVSGGNSRSMNVRGAATATLLATADPTTSYVASNYVNSSPYEKITAQFVLTWNSSTSIEWYWESSPDAVTWFRHLNLSAAAGVNTAVRNNQTIVLGASANWEDCIYVQDKYTRVNVKRTGGAASDTLAVTVTLLGA